MKKIFFFLCLACVVLSIPACGKCSNKRPRANHVVIIGVDGWGSFGLDSIDMPNIRKAMADGCYTLKKRTVLPSVSGPNWNTMFCGAPTEMTGYITNSDNPTLLPLYANERGRFPTVFDEMRTQRPDAEIGCVAEWNTVVTILDPTSFSYTKRTSQSKIGSREGLEESCKYILEKKPNLLFIHIDQVDHAGHGQGYGSPEYFNTVHLVDGYVGEIVQAMKDAGIWDDSVLIITSDHGGINKSHGGTSMREMETPFIIRGKGVRKGEVINAPMMEYDVAAVIADIFRLKHPSYWRCSSMDVFEKK